MGQSISLVEYSSPMGMVLATSQSKDVAALSSTLQTHFKNAHGSPFLHFPLALLVGNFGTAPAVTAILEGTFQCPPGVDEYTKNFMGALQFPLLDVHYHKVSTLPSRSFYFSLAAV